jgi:hypothetical protein
MSSKSRCLVFLPLGVAILSFCVLTLGGTTGKSSKHSANVTVSGCLQNGNTLDRFRLTGQDGKVYALRSSSLKLADHVRHRVTITGALKRDPKRDEYEFEGSELNEEYGKNKTADPVDVEVTNLKMISASCQ